MQREQTNLEPSPSAAMGSPRARRAPAAQAAAAFLVVWAAIAAWRWEIVWSPPYWDSAMGLFVEANFLAESDFDYRQLWWEQKRFLEGGPGVYLISVMPTLVACTMKATSTPTAVFFIGHLATFAVAAAIVLMVFAILRPRVGTGGAVVVALATITTPIFAVQVDMLGMDLPLAMLALAFVWLVARDRFFSALGVAGVAFFVKQSGAIILVAGVCVLLILAAAATVAERPERRRLWLASGAYLAALAPMLLLVQWLHTLPSSEPERLRPDVKVGLDSLEQLLTWCPTLVVVIASCAAGSVVVGLMWWAGQIKTQPAGSRLRGLLGALCQARAAWVLPAYGWLVLGGTLAGLALSYTIPRYLTLPLPLLMANLALLLFRPARSPVVGGGLLAALIVVNLVQLRGHWLPTLAGREPSQAYDVRTGAILERSREYLADHRANLELVHRVVEQHGDLPVVTGNPFAYFFSMPRLGYVARPLSGFTINTFTTTDMRPAADLLEAVPAGVVIVRAENRFLPIGTATLPAPLPGEPLLFGKEPADTLLAYRRVWPPRLDRSQRLAEVVRTFWPHAALRDRVTTLIAEGKYPDARTALAELLELAPNDPQSRLLAADLEIAEGHLDAAQKVLERLLGDSPGFGPAQLRLAEINAGRQHWTDADRWYARVLSNRGFLAERAAVPRDAAAIYFAAATAKVHLGQSDAARSHYLEAARLAPDWPLARRAAGKSLIESGQLDEAAIHLAAATRLEPENVEGHLLLARVWRDRGRADEARLSYLAAIAADPQSVAPHFELAQLFARNGQVDVAVDHLGEVIRLAPRSELADDARTLGAWLLATAPAQHDRDLQRALDWATRAAENTHRTKVESLDALAAAQAGLGQFDAAAATVQEALALADRMGIGQQRRAALAARLALYRRGEPYHEDPRQPPLEH